ncbi:MAG TPA: hypothetical protein VKB76_05990, partial [Ktedonobacterales bacterium]|nr:hypothetical protein [Ktedonobacterales bacterium]
RVGRLQLPKEAVDSIPFNGRADVRIMGDHVEIWPLGTGPSGGPTDLGNTPTAKFGETVQRRSVTIKRRDV